MEKNNCIINFELLIENHKYINTMKKLFILFIIFTILSGCETSNQDLIPTRSLDRSSDLSGKIHTIDLQRESTYPFQFGKGETEYLLAGSLEDVDAGIFLKFPAIKDTLISGRMTTAKLYLYSDETQGPDDGVFTARLQGVTPYWKGTDSLSVDSFMYEDLSISTVEVTRYLTTSETTLEEFEVTIFEFPADYVESWVDSGAFYMDADGPGSLLRSYYSTEDQEGFPPELLLRYENDLGGIDSILVRCLDDTYVIRTGKVFQEPLVVSEGTAYWVHVKFAIPDSIVRYSSVNRALLELPIIDSHLLDDSMILQIRLIEEQLTAGMNPTQNEDGLYKLVQINSDSTEFHVELRELVQKWVMWPDENYGVMIRGNNPFTRFNAVNLGMNIRLELLISDIPEYH